MIAHLVAVSIVMIAHLVAVSTAMIVRLAVTMIVLVVMTALIVMIVHVVSIVMIAHLVAALTAMTVHHALLHKNVHQKCAHVLVSDALQEKCRRLPTAQVRFGSMKDQHVPHVARLVFAQREQVAHKKAAARKCVHSIQWLKNSNANWDHVHLFVH
jgi:hypothetical protein